MLLALDIAKNVGWACGSPQTRAPQTGTLKLPDDLGRALVSLREWVAMTCSKASAVGDVAIEKLITHVNKEWGTDALVVLAQLQAVAWEASLRCGARVHFVAVGTWRRTFLGKGNLKSAEAKAGALKRCAQLGWPVDSHDAAEACGVFYHQMAILYPRWTPGKLI